MLNEEQKTEIEIIVREKGQERKHKFTIYPPFDDLYDWEDSEKLCKENEGRLPTIEELAIVNTIEKMGLTNTKHSGYYWSSSTRAGSPTYAWLQYFNNGNRYWDSKSNANYVRCVRS